MQVLFRIGSYGLLGAALVIAVITARLVSEGKRHLQEAMHLKGAADRDGAVAGLEDAAKAYVPGSPFPGRALRELGIMARAAEMRGEVQRATAIWEVVRRSVLATRHLFQPNQEALREAEENLIRLTEERFPERSGPSPVHRPEDPSPVSSILLFLGLAVWIGGAFWLCLEPRRRDRKSVIPGHIALIASLFGLALWLTMAWIA
jgi:hypothetical protein